MSNINKILNGDIMLQPEILTHPNIPKPLHGISPRTVMGQKWWDKTRKEVYEKQNYRCITCGVHKLNAKFKNWLEAHESYDIDYKNGIVIVNEIVALCYCCHKYIHNGLLEILVRKGDIPESHQTYIIKHGNKILKDADLKPWDVNKIKETAIWDKWHMIIGGIKYYSKFENYDEWFKYYNG